MKLWNRDGFPNGNDDDGVGWDNGGKGGLRMRDLLHLLENVEVCLLLMIKINEDNHEHNDYDDGDDVGGGWDNGGKGGLQMRDLDKKLLRKKRKKQRQCKHQTFKD